MKRCAGLLLVMLVSLQTGCVTRRFVITCEGVNPGEEIGAMVYRDGQPIGATPVEQPFIYYGKYRFRLFKDGYEPLDVEPEFVPPFYQWTGIDFISENLIPYPFRDVQRFHFKLQPIQAVRQDDVRNRAEQLRQQGSQIQTPNVQPSAPLLQNPAAPSVSPPPSTEPPVLPPPTPGSTMPIQTLPRDRSL
jgi:hypothetical protein